MTRSSVVFFMSLFFLLCVRAEALTCRTPSTHQVITGYALPWISGVSRLVTAGNCSPRNSFHSTSATWRHNINDGTFAYDFRMRYEPVCMMSAGWIIEFRDSEPDIGGTGKWGLSNFVKVLTPQNRVDYYTHLRQSWWTQQGQPQYNYLNRRTQVLELKSARGLVRWSRMFDGKHRLVHPNGRAISFDEYMSLAKEGYLDDLRVERAHCIAWSGSSGTTAAHLHVESRCSLTDSKTCPIHFSNAYIQTSNGGLQKEQEALQERRTYLAR